MTNKANKETKMDTKKETKKVDLYELIHSLPVQRVDYNELSLNPNNPRKAGNDDYLIHLDSLIESGVKEPLLVYHDKQSHDFIVVRGNLRLSSIKHIMCYDGEDASIYRAQKLFADGVPCKIIEDVDLSKEDIAALAMDFDRTGRSRLVVLEDIIKDIRDNLMTESQVIAKYSAELLSLQNLTVSELLTKKKAKEGQKRRVLNSYFHGTYLFCNKFAKYLPDKVWQYYVNSVNKEYPAIKQSDIVNLYNDIVQSFNVDGLKKFGVDNLSIEQRAKMRDLSYCQPYIERYLDDGSGNKAKEGGFKLTPKTFVDIAADCHSTTLRMLLGYISTGDIARFKQSDKILSDLEKADRIPVRDIVGTPDKLL